MDRERDQCLQAILEILDNAGYHRVRLPLNWFDRVVGGLCWAITASGERLTVDLLFQENIAVGRRIRLAENIVKALRSIRCPYDLQAHQIQGKDFASILRVVQWLAKHLEWTRQRTKKLHRDLALHSYHQTRVIKSYKQDTHSNRIETSRRDILQRIKQSSQPKRNLRIVSSSMKAEERADVDSRVRATLLEFGEDVRKQRQLLNLVDSDVKKESEMSAMEKRYATMLRQAQRAAVQRLEWAMQLEERLLKDAMNVKPSTESQEHLRELVAKESEIVKQAQLRYDQVLGSRERLDKGDGDHTSKRAELMRRKIDGTRTRIERATRKLSKVKEHVQVFESEVMEIESALSGEQEKIDLALEEVRRVQDAVASASGSQSDISRLRELVEQLEVHRKQEKEFKMKCKSKRKEMKAKLEEANAGQEQIPELQEKLARIEAEYQGVKKKRDKYMDVFSQCNQTVAQLRRKIDSFPTKSELIQFERRFVELYEQLASKLEENRRHITTYNTLETTHELLEKECTLLESINSTIQQTKNSRRGKEEFLAQFRGILQGLQARMAQMQATYQAKDRLAKQCEAEYRSLVDQERKYFEAVKQFQLACELNYNLSKAKE